MVVEKILELLKEKGFITYSDIIKNVDIPSYMISALMSSLENRYNIKKITPFYSKNPIYFLDENKVAEYLEKKIDEYLNESIVNANLKEELEKIREIAIYLKKIIEEYKDRGYFKLDEIEDKRYISYIYPIFIPEKIGNIEIFRYYKYNKDKVIEKIKEIKGSLNYLLDKLGLEFIESKNFENLKYNIVRLKHRLLNLELILYLDKNLDKNKFESLKKLLNIEKKPIIVFVNNSEVDEYGQLIKIYKINIPL